MVQPWPRKYGTQGTIPPRADEEEIIHPSWVRESVHQVILSLRNLAKLIQDKSRRVDEYRIQTLAGDSETLITLTPDFERIPEIIESVVITGPTATPAFTVKLGKRVWNLTLPATQILVIGPLSMKLGYEDDRFLQTAVAGDWSLELMGYADTDNRIPGNR